MTMHHTSCLAALLLAGCAKPDDHESPIDCAAMLDGVSYETIQAAISAAGAQATVEVCDGTWTENLVIASDLTLAAAAGAAPTIDGSGQGTTIQITGGAVTLQGLTITGGSGTLSLSTDAEAGSEESLRGGGVFAREAEALTVEGCTVVANTADFGAGVYGPLSGALTITDSALSDNTATLSGGGFLAVHVVITDSTISDNAADYGGGGITVNDGEVSLSGVELRGNIAETSGGGIYLESATATLEGVHAEGNTATYGGGIFSSRSGTVTIRDSVITANVGDTWGGGLLIRSGDAVVFEQVELSGNVSAENGGGALVYELGSLSASALTVTGNTVSGAEGYGGGLYTYDIDTVEIADAAFSDNEATVGGGLFCQNGGTVSITDSSLEDNVAGGELRFGGGAALHSNASVTLSGLTVAGNSAHSGGGLYLTQNPEVSISSSVLTDNVATGEETGYGGGLAIIETEQAVLSDLTLTGNTADRYGGGLMLTLIERVAASGLSVQDSVASWGGGVFASEIGELQLSDAEVLRNEAPESYGGGLYLLHFDSAALSAVDISDNLATAAGGMNASTDHGTQGELSLSGVTMVGNTADERAGALHIAGLKSVTITDSALTDNLATLGGGLYAWEVESVEISSSQIAGNMAAGYGGGAMLYDTSLSSVGSDWSDNTDSDVKTTVGDYDFDRDFTCAADGRCAWTDLQ